MIKELIKFTNKPEVYAPSTSKFWDDEHISKHMLKAHFDESTEAATRKPEVVNQIVSWISSLKTGKQMRLLDLGCGPGIYLEKFAELGFQATGIDLSKRSIDYSIKSAKEKNLNINYKNMNYLELDEHGVYDIITLIYYDYAVLSPSQRDVLLKRIYKALKPGGIFAFDVFTPHKYDGVSESSSWYIEEHTGFWKDAPYLCLENHYIYDHYIHLDQYVIYDENHHIETYRVWDQAFTKDMIIDELSKAGFKDISIYSNLTGKPYDENSFEMGIITKKE
jgi:SAM-dependent methyltransferase